MRIKFLKTGLRRLQGKGGNDKKTEKKTPRQEEDGMEKGCKRARHQASAAVCFPQRYTLPEPFPPTTWAAMDGCEAVTAGTAVLRGG